MCALRHAFEAANLLSLFYKIMKMEYGVSEQYKGGNTNINNWRTAPRLFAWKSQLFVLLATKEWNSEKGT